MRDFKDLLNDIKLLVRDDVEEKSLDSQAEEPPVIDYKEYRNLQGDVSSILKSLEIGVELQKSDFKIALEEAYKNQTFKEWD